MSRSAFSLVTSRFNRAISNCSGFIWPWPGNACCGSSANFFTQSRNCEVCTPRSADACAYDTPRSLIRRTASSLNSRVNCRLSMTHLLLHKTPNLVPSEPGAAQVVAAEIANFGFGTLDRVLFLKSFKTLAGSFPQAGKIEDVYDTP